MHFASREQKKTYIAYLSSWHKSIFGNKLRTIEDKKSLKS